MRLGTCIPDDESTYANGEYSLDRALDLMAESGICGCMTNFPSDEPQWERSSRVLAASLRRSGVTLLEYNLPFFIPAASREQCLSVARRIVEALALAESIGCLNVVACVANAAGLLPDPRSRSRDYAEALKDTCDRVAEEAGRRGLRARLLIEMVYTTAIWSPEALARLVDEIGSPNVQGHMDVVNCLTFDNIYSHAQFVREAFDALHGRICSAHLKDVSPAESYLPGLRDDLVGDGVMDLRTYLECLGRLPNDFPVVIEHMHARADIERSYRRIVAIADDLSLPVWSD